MTGRFAHGRCACFGAAIAAAVAVWAAPDANAQATNRGVPNALQGFSQNRDQPVQIEASSLEVRDKDKVATFSGNVKVVQGDTTMRCRTLVVFYEGQGGSGAMRAASPGPGGSQQISRLEARGGVTVTQKDHTATGDTGLFDMRANTVTLVGNVIVSQGKNVMRGDRLVVNLTTGVSRVEAGKSQGQVRMLIQQQPQQQQQQQQPQQGGPQQAQPGLLPPPPRIGPPRSLSPN
ncbi:MAG: lipopolysaccharide transport periplasmic protein LptA [Alphaproteobacteria bacterium]|nr:lipopolysaccharide transport periplasmic protein LptA [Alphaproteobacteria bacterium]